MEADYYIDEEQLEEVEELENGETHDDIDTDQDETAMDQDEMIVSEDDDEEFQAENVNDMSIYTFNRHTDFLYCIALHPTRIGVVATGITNCLYLQSLANK